MLHAKLKFQMKQVGAPLAGLIRSERVQSTLKIGGVVIASLYLSATLG
jgi:hypothetical protein